MTDIRQELTDLIAKYPQYNTKTIVNLLLLTTGLKPTCIHCKCGNCGDQELDHQTLKEQGLCCDSDLGPCYYNPHFVAKAKIEAVKKLGKQTYHIGMLLGYGEHASNFYRCINEHMWKRKPYYYHSFYYGDVEIFNVCSDLKDDFTAMKLKDRLRSILTYKCWLYTYDSKLNGQYAKIEIEE